MSLLITRSIGLFIIILALLANPWMLGKFTESGSIIYPIAKTIIYFIELAMTILGMAIMIKPKWFIYNSKEIFTLLVTVCICVLILTLAGLMIHPNPSETLKKFDPHLGWSVKADESLIKEGIVFSTNSLGFRGEPINEGQEQVVVLGDSVAWGYMVSDNETIPFYLDKLLDEQVLNLAVSGYDPGQYYLQLERFINLTNPTKVVVVLFPDNDLKDFMHDNAYGKSKPFFRMDDENLVLDKENLKENSCMNYVSSSLLVSKFHLTPIKKICPSRSMKESEAKESVKQILKKIVDLGHEKGAEVFFVISPAKIDFPEKSDNLEFFEDILEEEGYAYYNHYQVLQNYDVDSLYIDTSHYTPAGNELMALNIAEFLR